MAKSSLKELAREQFSKVWDSDRMINFCVGKLDSLVDIGSGLYAIDKPDIHKDFWFGYHDSRTDTESFDKANEMAEAAEKSVDYFMTENMAQSNFDRWIKILSEYVEGTHCWVLKCFPHYYSQAADCRLVGVEAYRNCYDVPTNMEGCRDLTTDEARVLIESYKAAKDRFNRRLVGYVKRYGLSQVHTDIYWADR